MLPISIEEFRRLSPTVRGIVYRAMTNWAWAHCTCSFTYGPNMPSEYHTCRGHQDLDKLYAVYLELEKQDETNTGQPPEAADHLD